MAALNLFGIPQSTTFDVDAAPDTELDLKLLGIFLASPPDASIAIIGSRGDPGEAYGVGDPIFGNAKLAEVRRNIVLISRAGIMEALRFDDNPPLAANRPPASTYPQGTTEPSATLDVRDAMPTALTDSIEEFREALEQDPEGALRSVGLEPVSIDGDTGYRIGRDAAARQLGRTGLQPGDTILSINGRPLSDVQRDPEVLGDLLASDSARLEIQRGDRRFFLTTSLEALVALTATDREPA